MLAATLGDGAAGLSALKQCDGITVVQDPSDAAIPEMPTTALTRLEPDHVVGLAGMPRVETLTEIHRQPCSITRPRRRAPMSAWGQSRHSDVGSPLPVDPAPDNRTFSEPVGMP
jgi:hypothetical protein